MLGSNSVLKWSEVAQSYPTLCDPMDTRLLRPWDFLGKSSGVGCHFLLQGIFPTQGSNPGLLHCRQTLYCLSHQGSPTGSWIPSNNYNGRRGPMIHKLRTETLHKAKCKQLLSRHSIFSLSQKEKKHSRNKASTQLSRFDWFLIYPFFQATQQ